MAKVVGGDEALGGVRGSLPSHRLRGAWRAHGVPLLGVALVVSLLAGALSSRTPALHAAPVREREACVGAVGQGDSPRSGAERLLEAVSGPLERLDAAGLIGPSPSIRVVLLDDGAASTLETLPDAAIEALEARVREGLGLVVRGAAARARPGDERFSRLLGRDSAWRPDATGEDSSAGAPPQAPSRPCVLHVPDQSHPVTQCLTALWLRRPLEAPDPSATARPLLALVSPGGQEEPAVAQGARSWRPVAWMTKGAEGAVIVLGGVSARTGQALDEGVREVEALDVLAARAVLWIGRLPGDIRLPADLPLAVERLGPQDEGLFPGAPAIPGFYRGREVAEVMGFGGASWLLRADREATEMPEKTLDALEIAPNETLVDFGAGAGYFTLRMARRVAQGGRVIACDLEQRMLDLLARRAAAEGMTNIEPVLTREDDPGLPKESVDLILLVDVYHELARPRDVLERLRGALKPRGASGRPGRLVLVEYRGEDPSVPIKPLHRTTVAQVRGEVEPAGFRLVRLESFLPLQHILIFERIEGGAPAGRP